MGGRGVGERKALLRGYNPEVTANDEEVEIIRLAAMDATAKAAPLGARVMVEGGNQATNLFFHIRFWLVSIAGGKEERTFRGSFPICIVGISESPQRPKKCVRTYLPAASELHFVRRQVRTND